jgi:hypothetical protein
VPGHIASGSSLVRLSLRSTASALAIGAAALSCPAEPARAACSPTLTPTTAQTVTCDSSQPNPVTTGIVAQPGSTNVTVNMLSGAQLNVGGGDAVVLGGGGQVTNSSGAIIQGVRGVNVTGPTGIDNFGQIGGNGGPRCGHQWSGQQHPEQRGSDQRQRRRRCSVQYHRWIHSDLQQRQQRLDQRQLRRLR